MAKVTDYTFAAVADDRPNFPLSRPALDGSGVVRLKSSALEGAGGVRLSKCVPDIGGRAGVRADFKTCKTRYDALSPAELAQWTTWSAEDDMEVFQFVMRTCQVYERRAMSWPPASMAAWKGWVYRIWVSTWWTPAIDYARLYAQADVGSGAFSVSVACKVETNQDSGNSDARLFVGGYYNDGGGDQPYYAEHSFGAGSQAWAVGSLDVPPHNWLAGYPDICVDLWEDTGNIWVDEFKITQGGVELNLNPHFNGGWDDLKKHPEDYVFLWGSASGGTRLMYLEDVP